MFIAVFFIIVGIILTKEEQTARISSEVPHDTFIYGL